MLYSVIPPLLLVLSVIGIIIFFVKKAPEAERLGRLSEENRSISGAGGRMRMASGGFRKIWLFILRLAAGLSRKSLASLEKSVGKMAGTVKDRKARRSERQADAAKRQDEYLIEKLNNYEETAEPEPKRRIVAEEEKPVRPMLSDRVVVPDAEERRMKEERIRERLENVLIERIAMNPRDTEAYERLGEYYFDLENYEHAKECFKQVIKLDPTNRSVKYKMKKLETLLSR